MSKIVSACEHVNKFNDAQSVYIRATLDNHNQRMRSRNVVIAAAAKGMAGGAKLLGFVKAMCSTFDPSTGQWGPSWTKFDAYK